MTKSIVIVATSASELSGHPTGLWIEEMAAPYYKFKDAGYDIVISSPRGGPIPIDAASMGKDFFTEASKKFMHDGEAFGKLSHSVPISSVDVSAVDAIFFCGGHGTCVDFVDDVSVKSTIESLYGSGKVVAAVCHGPTCLVQCTKEDGTPLVQGLTVAAFTDKEEEMVQLAEKVPFLLEAKLKEQGCKFESADPWSSKVCVDGKLVTGQNPQSSEACADAVIEIIGKC